MDLLSANLLSLFANVYSIANYLYLQKTGNVLRYTIFCLINCIFFVIRCLSFRDYSGAILEIFWVIVSIYGINKHRKKNNV